MATNTGGGSGGDTVINNSDKKGSKKGLQPSPSTGAGGGKPPGNSKYAEFMRQDRRQWDPCFPAGTTTTKPFLPVSCVHRIKRDIKTVIEDMPPGISVQPDSSDISRIHALIIGPFDTPYEGGFFHFILQCPPTYPIQPPKVKLLTTGSGRVRFNPNLYKSGKVCLSILGTWEGPAWTPAMNILSVLLSIQSLLNDKPYHNEPGYTRAERYKGDSDKYNKIIQHETLRAAVCQFLEEKGKNDALPDMLLAMAMNSFGGFYAHYNKICHDNMALDGSLMSDPFGEERGTYNYSSILSRLTAIRKDIEATPGMMDDDDSDFSLSD